MSDKKISLSDLALPNRKRYLRNASRFHTMFRRPLKDFWEGNLIGFDVIAFDQFIAPEKGESTKDAILRKHGIEAWDMVLDLISG